MEPTSLISLVNRYDGLSVEDCENLRVLADQYPYSQLLHTLAARAAKDLQLPDYQGLLQIAAVHAADRSVLKEVMNGTVTKTNVTPPAAEPVSAQEPVKRAAEAAAVAEPTVVSTEIQVVESTEILSTYEGFDVADEVMKDLDRLNELKHNFEMLFVEYSEVVATAKEEKPTDVDSKNPSDDGERVVLKGKSKKARIVELARAMKATDPEVIKPPAKRKKASKAKDQSDEFIEQIESKSAILPDSEKQKEQNELIDQFIKSQPTISNAKDRQQVTPHDLNPIKSGEFTDNIISETLVEILIKQGKKDKAIEVLKKLIWKYPQKKAYFASQIEELKK